MQAISGSYASFLFREWHGGEARLNLDGVVVSPSRRTDDGRHHAYVQVFRSGAMEAVRRANTSIGQNSIGSTAVSAFVRDAILKFLDRAEALGIAGPCVVAISLLRVKGLEFAHQTSSRDGAPVADRENMNFPEIWVESVPPLTEREPIVRNALDALWQAFDVDRCILFGDDGVWRAPR